MGISINGLAAKSFVSYIGSKDGNTLMYYSNINIFVNIAATLGPLLGTYLLSEKMSSYVFQISGIFFILSGIIVLLFLNITEQCELPNKSINFWNGYKSVLLNYDYLKFLFFNMFGWFFYAQLFASLPYFVNTYYGVEKKLGMLYTLNALMIIFLQLIVSSLIRRYIPDGKENYRLLLVFTLFSVSFLSAGIFNSFYGLFITIIVFTFAEMIFTPLVDTLVSKYVDSNLRTTYFSILGLFTAIGEGSGNYFGLRLLGFWGNLNHHMYFWLTLAALATSISLVLLVVVRKRNIYSEKNLNGGL